MKNSISLITACFLSALLMNCSDVHKGAKEPIYLARVGSSYLTLEDAKEEIPAFIYQRDSTQSLETFRSNWVQRQLLLKEARNLQLNQKKKVQKRLEEARQEVILNALSETIITQFKNQHPIVTDAEAVEHFEQNKEKLILNEKYVKFRHVETQDLGTARQAREWLQNDSSWTNVAQRFTMHPEEKIREAEKFWPLSSVFSNLSIMKNYASRLDSSQISPIQRREGIYHFIQMVDVKTQGDPVDSSWFTNQLKEWLIREKQRKYYNSYVKNLYFVAKENNELEVFNVSTSSKNDQSNSTDTTETNE